MKKYKVISSSQEELKSCPFCGNDPILHKDEFIDFDQLPNWWVECSVCNIKTIPSENKEEVINDWESRVNNKVTSLIKKYEEEIAEKEKDDLEVWDCYPEMEQETLTTITMILQRFVKELKEL